MFLVLAAERLRLQPRGRLRGDRERYYSIPGAGGEEPTAAEERSSSRGAGAVRIPGAGGEEGVKPIASTRGHSLRESRTVRISGAGSK